jgi:uncharacterized membrane protein
MIQWYYLALISSAMLGVATLLEKNTLKVEHAMAYSTSFSVIMALISLLFLPLANFNISALSIVLIYLLSLMSAAIYWLLARVYKHGSVSAASPVYNALPNFFIVIFAFLFLGEKLTTLQYFFTGVLIFATYLIMFTGKPQFESKKYVQWLILASLISAVQATGMKYLLLNANPYTYLILLEVFVALNMVIGMQLKYGGIKETFGNTLKYKKEIVLIAAFTTAYRVFYYVAASMANIALVWPLSNVLNVIMLVFLGGLIFKEGSVKRKLVIAAAMLAAIYFLVV